MGIDTRPQENVRICTNRIWHMASCNAASYVHVSSSSAAPNTLVFVLDHYKNNPFKSVVSTCRWSFSPCHDPTASYVLRQVLKLAMLLRTQVRMVRFLRLGGKLVSW